MLTSTLADDAADRLAFAQAFDAAGRLIRVDAQRPGLGEDPALLWAATGYDENGVLLAEQFGSGAATAYERDDLGVVTRVRVGDAVALSPVVGTGASPSAAAGLEAAVWDLPLPSVRPDLGVRYDGIGAPVDVTDHAASTGLDSSRKSMPSLTPLASGCPAPTALAPVPPVPPVVGELDALVEKAVASRPEIAARRKAVEATRVLVREAELRWLPIVTFGGHVRAPDTEGFTGENVSWALNLNLIFPVYDRGERYADLDKHRQQLDVLEAELQKAEKDIRDGIRTHRVAVENADRSMQSAARQTELARKTAEVIQRALKAGVITNLEVAEADTNVRLAEENEANLRWRRDLAMLQLRHAAGLLEVPR